MRKGILRACSAYSGALFSFVVIVVFFVSFYGHWPLWEDHGIFHRIVFEISQGLRPCKGGFRRASAVRQCIFIELLHGRHGQYGPARKLCGTGHPAGPPALDSWGQRRSAGVGSMVYRLGHWHGNRGIDQAYGLATWLCRGSLGCLARVVPRSNLGPLDCMRRGRLCASAIGRGVALEERSG